MLDHNTSEYDLRIALKEYFASHDCDPRFSLIKSGTDSVGGQVNPSHTPIKKGCQIWFDIGAVLNGYWVDIARTAYWGDPPKQMISNYAALKAGCDQARSLARPGMTGSELFDITVKAVRDSGLPNYRRNHVGHGIGTEVYEPVFITPNSKERLQAGTVVNIETPYYSFETGALHIEDPFLVQPQCNPFLSGIERDLIVIP